MAYNSKRQLQTSADAASLAAAAIYAQYPGTCATLAANATYRTAAEAAADSYSARNELDFATFDDGSITDVSCNADGELEVTYDVSGTTETIFGGLTGSGPTIETSRSAAATVDVPTAGGTGLRPLALCSSQLPSNWQTAGVIRIDYPGSGHVPPSSCPVPSTPGNWWTVDCPEERTGSASQMATQILNGCGGTVTVIPGQAAATTPAALSTLLTTACPSAPTNSPTCLSGDPGNLDAGQVADSWRALMDNETRVILPVFCGVPRCSPSTITGNGTNAIFPVHALAGMRICGFHFDKTPAKNKGAKPTGDCSALPIDPLSDGTKDNYLLVRFTTVMTSGSTNSTDCSLGGTCDSGLRRVHLSK